MKILAWVLGLAALIGSCPLGVNWFAARDGLRAVTMVSAKARDDIRDRQAAVRLEEMKRESEAEKIRFDIREDEVAVESARLQGTGLDAAEQKLTADEKKQSEMQTKLTEQQAIDSVGEDDSLVAAKKRLEAARLSAGVYRDWLAIDEKLAYALGFVWLTFGISIAFVPRKG